MSPDSIVQSALVLVKIPDEPPKCHACRNVTQSARTWLSFTSCGTND